MFPLHDPERRPAYSLPNDRVLAWAEESEGRLIPFCRLDPFEGPVAEAERCLAAGARGIKLHPRAQEFAFDGKELEGIFAVADDARVPILIHAGRGLPPIAEGLAQLALRHPEVVLILAHGAICDQGILTSVLAEHPGVLYDTSCFFGLDVVELFARSPPSGSCSPPIHLMGARRVAFTWCCAWRPTPASTRPPHGWCSARRLRAV